MQNRQIAKDYQYINKECLPNDLRNDYGKRIAFLWLLTKDDRQTVENSSAQNLAPFYVEELKKLTLESGFEAVINYIDTLTHPSAVSKWINNIDSLLIEEWFPNKLRALRRTHYLQPPTLEISTTPLYEPTHLQPPIAFIAHLNAVDAQLTGYLIENIFARLLYPSDEKWRSEEHVNEKITPGESVDGLAWSEGNQLYYDRMLKNEFGEFKSVYHALLYLTVKQYFNMDYSASGVGKSATFIDFFVRDLPSAFEMLHAYSQSLASTTYVAWFKRKIELLGDDAFPFHSISLHGEIEGKEYNGEADFIIGDTIIDAKAVKQPVPRTWFAQVNIYKQLCSRTINTMEVISFLNNTVYHFKC